MQELHSFQRKIFDTAANANGAKARTTAQFNYQGPLAKNALLAKVEQALNTLLSNELADNLLVLRSETFAQSTTHSQSLAALSAHLETQSADNDVVVVNVESAESPGKFVISLPSGFCDAQSTLVLNRALNQALENEELPALMDYEKYALWQQSSLEPEACIFWDNYLQQDTPENPLRFVAPQSNQPYIAHTETCIDLATISGEKRSDSSLKALWAALMQRLSLAQPMSLGIVADGRVLPPFQDSLGLYAVTIPLSLQFAGNTQIHSVAEQLDAFIADNVDAQISVPPNDRWTAGPVHTLQFIDTQSTAQALQLEDVNHHCGEFHTQLLCVKHGNQLTLRLFYNGAHYNNQSMQQTLDCFVSLLTSVELSCDINQLSLANTATSVRSNRTDTIDEHTKDGAVSDKSDSTQSVSAQSDSLGKHTVIDYLQQWAQHTGNAVAAQDANSQCTYAELQASTNALAIGVQTAIAGSAKRVALLMENSVQLVKAVCGVLRAGHAIVPVDVSQMTAREQAILSECDSVIVDSLGAKMLADYRDSNGNQAPVALSIDTLLATPVTTSSLEQLAATTISSDSVANVIYTSGTTGRPKGTLVTHANLMSYLTSAKSVYWQGVSKSLVHTPISFDMAHTSFFLPLLAGGCVEMLSVDNSLDTLTAALDRQTSPVLLKLTPSHIRAMKPWFEQIHTTFDNIAVIVVGGEQLYSNDLRLIQQKMVNTRVINEYGPTETTVGVSHYEVSVEDVGAIPIGHPFPHAQFYVVDEQGCAVAPGMIGELYIGGTSVANGYWQQAALTAERFIDAPAPLNYMGKLYKTGDLVVQSSNNLGLRFLRRNDNQLKIRGYRIEKEEVIAGLTSLNNVQAAQLVVSQQEQGVQLFAFVTGPAADAVDALKAALQQQLPSYMQPHRLHVVSNFPLTANGKIDETALLALSEQQSQQRTNEYVAPTTDTEKRLVDIWKSALDINELGVTDNFFDLGGDSIRAIYIASTAKENGFSLKVQDIMQNPTISALAPIVDDASNTLDNLEGMSDTDLAAAIDDMDISDVDSLLNELDNA